MLPAWQAAVGSKKSRPDSISLSLSSPATFLLEFHKIPGTSHRSKNLRSSELIYVVDIVVYVLGFVGFCCYMCVYILEDHDLVAEEAGAPK